MKKIKIKGKDYVMVHERVKEFHKDNPNGSITTDMISREGGVFITRTTVIPDTKNLDRKFTGFAYEVVGEGNVNSTSALENCETSSCGRALGFLGIGIDTSIASAEEVDNAISQQDVPIPEYLESPDKKMDEIIESLNISHPINFGKHKGKDWSDVDEDYVQWVAKNSNVDWQRDEAKAELKRRKV